MILENVQCGKIVSAPLNGSPVVITKIPQGLMPVYSGAVLILGGDQTQGDINLNIKSALQLIVKGNAVVLSQATWHSLEGN